MRVLCGLVATTLLCGAEIRLSEIMYHPPQSEDLEFLELAVVAGGDFSHYRVAGAVSFTFPEGVFVETGAFLLLARNPEALQSHYTGGPTLEPFAYSGLLGNGGEEILLLDPDDTVLERIPYGDDPPWDFLADGLGRSLSRICMTADAHEPHNWLALDPTPGAT